MANQTQEFVVPGPPEAQQLARDTSPDRTELAPKSGKGSSKGGRLYGVGAGRRDIQGLRALAVLLVIVFHIDRRVLPGGFTGVDVFFVISGCVITSMILRQGNSFSWIGFASRRIKRLLPALAAMVVAVVVASLLLQSPLGEQQLTGKTAFGAMALVANVVVARAGQGYFDGAAGTNPLLHTWSLSVEEQFYIVFPIIVLLLVRTRRIALTSLAVVIAASGALSLALSYGWAPAGLSSPESWAFYSSPTRAWEFAAGAAIAVLPVVNRRFATSLSVAGVALLAVGAWRITETTSYPGLAALLPVVGTCLLILAGGAGSNPISRLLSTRAAVAIGDHSYSLYLWHWPFIVFAAGYWSGTWPRVCAAFISVAVAMASLKFLENPLRRAQWTNRRVIASGVAVALIVGALGIALAKVAPRIGGRSTLYTEQASLTLGRTNDCVLFNRSYARGDLSRCTYKVPNPKGLIVLAGDSHADALSTSVAPAAAQLGYSTLALNGAGCDFVRKPPETPFVPNCAQMSTDVLNLAKKKASLVVVSHWGVGQSDWPQALEPTLRELAQTNTPVLFVLDVPNHAPRQVNTPPACRGGILNFTCETTVDQVEKFQGDVRTKEKSLASRFPNVTVYDPWPAFCNDSTCSALVNGRLAYLDYDHLNAIGGEALQSSMKSAMEKALGN